MKISIGSDHAGYKLKELLKDYLVEEGYEVLDKGTNSTESVDYPDFGHAVGKSVSSGEADFGVVVCGSGIGISLAANKVPGVRAALCSEPLSAELSRKHNDANVVSVGARLIGLDMAKKILDTFLNTEFEAGRHERRVNMIEEV